MVEEKKEENDVGEIGKLGMFLIVIIMGIMLFSFVVVVYNSSTSMDRRYEVVEGKIINSYPILDDNGQIDYLSVTFDNGKHYKIKINDDVDLTVNSKLVLELKYYVERDWFWNEYERDDDVYYIERIVKIP